MTRRFTISLHRGVETAAGFEHRGDHLDWFFAVSADPNTPLLTFSTQIKISSPGDFVAIRLPDHRNRYLDYDGEVSDNRGEVQRLISGTYRMLEHTSQRFAFEIESEIIATTLSAALDHELQRALCFSLQTKTVALVLDAGHVASTTRARDT